jgi:hypothetical protein
VTSVVYTASGKCVINLSTHSVSIAIICTFNLLLSCEPTGTKPIPRMPVLPYVNNNATNNTTRSVWNTLYLIIIYTLHVSIIQ